MANYDVYKTIICPIADSYGELFTTTRTINIPIIEWNSDTASGFDMANVATPTSILLASDRTQYIACSLLETQDLSSAGTYVYLSGRNDPNYGIAYGVYVDGVLGGNSSSIATKYWTLCYDPARNRTFVILYYVRDSRYGYLKITYTPSGYDYIGELYTFSNLIPKKATNLELSPTLSTIEKSSNIQFSLNATYESGEVEDVTNIAEWGIASNTIEEPMQELNGFTIDGTGLLTAIDPIVSSIVVSAKYGGLGAYTTIYVSGFPGIYAPGGTTGAGGGSTGGTGNFGKNEVSDSVLPPSGSVEGDASATGMYTRYLVNSSYLDLFGDWLWTTDLGLAIAKSVISAIYGDPAESVIGLLSFPFQLANTETMSGLVTKQQNLFWGNHDSLLTFIAVHSNAVTINWGTIELSEYWGNFLDYTPHTKIDLYLPWGTGFVSIDPGQCLPGTLKVITNVELSKGSCIHNVIGNNDVVIGSFAGQCGKQMPLFSSDFASKMAGLVTVAAAGIVVGASAAVGMAAGASYGSKLGTTTPSGYFIPQEGATIDMAAEQMMINVSETGKVAGKIATSSLAINKTPTHVTRNGGFTDGSASLGVQYPYIILSRPTQSVPEEYGHHYGYPSNITATLRTIKGYTEIGEIHLDGIHATDTELKELDAILKGGVIF